MFKSGLSCIFILLFSCSSHFAQETREGKPYFVYHIPKNEQLDSSYFEPCNEQWILPYYAGSKTSYQGDRPALIAHFNSFETPENSSGQTGYITIRFIVNCKGQAGRYRIEEFNKDYQRFTFNKEISRQLVALTKTFDRWIACQYDGKAADSYYYLCFQLRHGKLISITP